MSKPYAFAEVLARVEALGRRVDRARGAAVLTVDDLALDLRSRSVVRGGRPLTLLQREFQLLEFLMWRAGTVVTRSMLLEGVWDYNSGSAARSTKISNTS